MLQRTPSRQTIAIVCLQKYPSRHIVVFSFFQHHQMVPDPMDQAEVDTTGLPFFTIPYILSFRFFF